jgi:phosphoglycerol geranylgeranyltransferase
MGKLFETLKTISRNKGAGFLLLLDPDRVKPRDVKGISKAGEEAGVDAFLVGGSLLLSDAFEEAIKALKSTSKLPVFIFPGSVSQLSSHADGILFLSLISGRNSTYLIDKHVRAAPMIKRMGLECVPVGYMLIESGKLSSVEFMSNTRPVPRDKVDVAMAHALAAEYLGMQAVYLEAGSGAKESVSEAMVKSVKGYINIPVIVGGGLRTPDEARSRARAGADFIVIGTALEGEKEVRRLRDFAKAIHWRAR